jgi:alkanesulfonate monooxygenase SsuD/methylene tetrahydromethanopterin reductase-like flavin-dependent oxidoreductase (luciferase family)
MLAKEISTLCHLSQGRYLFGVGPGWYAREYEVTGTRIEERGKRTDELIEAVLLSRQAQRELPAATTASTT